MAKKIEKEEKEEEEKQPRQTVCSAMWAERIEGDEWEGERAKGTASSLYSYITSV